MAARPGHRRNDTIEPDREGFQRFGKLELAREEVERLSSAELIDRLIALGTSRLTAHRIVEIERGGLEPGRARAHSQSRR